MAKKIGLKSQWFQRHKRPHYDLCQQKRKLAVQSGAIEIDRQQVGQLIRNYQFSRYKNLILDTRPCRQGIAI